MKKILGLIDVNYFLKSQNEAYLLQISILKLITC